MPKEHADLITWARENTPISEETPGRTDAVEELRLFRSEHIKTVGNGLLTTEKMTLGVTFYSKSSQRVGRNRHRRYALYEVPQDASRRFPVVFTIFLYFEFHLCTWLLTEEGTFPIPGVTIFVCSPLSLSRYLVNKLRYK